MPSKKYLGLGVVLGVGVLLFVLLPSFATLYTDWLWFLEVGHEQVNILAPAVQGRHLDVHHVQAVVQVLAELAGRHEILQVPVSGRDHAHIDGNRIGAAHRANHILLQHAQQLDLQAHRHVADLIQHEGAAVGRHEQPAVGAGGTGYAASRPRAANYLQSYRRGVWKLPPFAPELIVLQGGGNDANQGKQLSEVSQNARQLAYLLHHRYPGSRLVMVGVLSRSANDGGGRRLVVDSLLARTAEELKIPFVDAGGWVSTYGLKNDMADGVHLKPSGHQRLTPVFAEHLSRSLENR